MESQSIGQCNTGHVCPGHEAKNTAKCPTHLSILGFEKEEILQLVHIQPVTNGNLTILTVHIDCGTYWKESKKLD